MVFLGYLPHHLMHAFKQAVAIHLLIERLHKFLLNVKFKIMRDHQALKLICGPDKSLAKISKMCRFQQRLQLRNSASQCSDDSSSWLPIPICRDGPSKLKLAHTMARTDSLSAGERAYRTFPRTRRITVRASDE